MTLVIIISQVYIQYLHNSTEIITNLSFIANIGTIPNEIFELNLTTFNYINYYRICPAGTYNDGSGNCKECLAGTYSDEEGALSSDTCKDCPIGRTTDLPGATSFDDCIDIQSNLIFGIMFMILLPIFVTLYIVRGKIYWVAYSRKKYFERLLVPISNLINIKLSLLMDKSKDAKFSSINSSTSNCMKFSKIFTYMLFNLFMFVVFIMVSYTMYITEILFKCLIAIRGGYLFKNFSIEDTINNVIQVLEFDWKLPYLSYLLYPFGSIIIFFSNLNILDFSAVNVTCKGSQAPFELIFYIFIFGYILNTIESEYHIFQSFTLGNTTKKFVELSLTYDLGLSRVKYFLLLISAGILMLILLNPMLILLQWLIGLLFISHFLGIHESTPSCDTIKGYEHIDTILAVLSSLIALSIIPHIVFVCGKILIPQDNDKVHYHIFKDLIYTNLLNESPLNNSGSFNLIILILFHR